MQKFGYIYRSNRSFDYDIIIVGLRLGMFAASVFPGVAIDLGLRDHSGLNPIHYTCQRGDLALFDQLFFTTPKLRHKMLLNVKAHNASEMQPIHFASRNKNQSIINKLLLLGIMIVIMIMLHQ